MHVTAICHVPNKCYQFFYPITCKQSLMLLPVFHYDNTRISILELCCWGLWCYLSNFTSPRPIFFIITVLTSDKSLRTIALEPWYSHVELELKPRVWAWQKAAVAKAAEPGKLSSSPLLGSSYEHLHSNETFSSCPPKWLKLFRHPVGISSCCFTFSFLKCYQYGDMGALAAVLICISLLSSKAESVFVLTVSHSCLLCEFLLKGQVFLFF